MATTERNKASDKYAEARARLLKIVPEAPGYIDVEPGDEADES